MQNWDAYTQEWRQYDSVSAFSTIIMTLSNVLRSTASSSSYETLDTVQALRATQACAAVSLAVNFLVLWALYCKPDMYQEHRHALTAARWVSVSGIVIVSTPLPVFQAGQAFSNRWWLLQAVGFAFRSGVMFCVVGAVFFRMPWQYMAAIGCLYATCSSFTSTGYCRSVLAAGSGHADWPIIHDTAALLDFLVGQGAPGEQKRVELMQHVTPSTAVGVVAGHGPDLQQLPWQALATSILTTCSHEAGQQQAQQGCGEALFGQCRATVITVYFGLTYIMSLLLWTLERYSKWRFLQQYQQQQQQQQQQHQDQRQQRWQHQQLRQRPAHEEPPQHGAMSSSVAAMTAVGPSPGSAHSSDDNTALLQEQFKAPTASAFLRMELLKLLVLADVPILLLWWALSSWLRTPLPAET